MERSEFYKKLVRSLFLITAVAALSLALSSRSKGPCHTAKDCRQCQSAPSCSLPTKK